MRGSRNMSNAWLVVALALALLAVSVCLPTICSPAMMAAGLCAECAAPMHAMPIGSASHPTSCEHSTGGSVQASLAEKPTAPQADVVAYLPAATTPVLTAAAFVRPVAQEPSPPPGVVLTASQLRI